MCLIKGLNLLSHKSNGSRFNNLYLKGIWKRVIIFIEPFQKLCCLLAHIRAEIFKSLFLGDERNLADLRHIANFSLQSLTQLLIYI
ncbi:hypothetical protein D3C79_1042330 [compost metagenome]